MPVAGLLLLLSFFHIWMAVQEKPLHFIIINLSQKEINGLRIVCGRSDQELGGLAPQSESRIAEAENPLCRKEWTLYKQTPGDYPEIVSSVKSEQKGEMKVKVVINNEYSGRISSNTFIEYSR